MLPLLSNLEANPEHLSGLTKPCVTMVSIESTQIRAAVSPMPPRLFVAFLVVR
jgi:hypothetical protein